MQMGLKWEGWSSSLLSLLSRTTLVTFHTAGKTPSESVRAYCFFGLNLENCCFDFIAGERDKFLIIRNGECGACCVRPREMEIEDVVGGFCQVNRRCPNRVSNGLAD
ncbi:hypothetical protein CDAR_617251 [Caerostris darwini]|uniref:Uncharacterized protein n=1 Tax=Caerostris darwini TaxID=1538125 RepID=A0AAV4NVI1_9ARAC|nr:hypothetical protein CDAR_617251 [Caerostris darwini]